MMGDQCLYTLAKQLHITHIRKPDTTAGNLILISRAYASACGANFIIAAHFLTRLICSDMHIKYQADILSNSQIIRMYLNPLPAQQLHLMDKGMRVNHHPITDNGFLVWSDNARGKQR